MEERQNRIPSIYDAFEAAAAPYKRDAACHKGCAFCCSDAGSIDITTLEGLVIRDRLAGLPRPRQLALKKALDADRRRRERGRSSPCPFLQKNRTCPIYTARPFACRRVYSLKVCSADQHPVLSCRVMELGETTIRQLQQLDDTGYSGHLSYILHMLDAPAFLKTYLSGDYQPEAVMVFGKRHKIVINRMMATREAAVREDLADGA